MKYVKAILTWSAARLEIEYEQVEETDVTCTEALNNSAVLQTNSALCSKNANFLLCLVRPKIK